MGYVGLIILVLFLVALGYRIYSRGKQILELAKSGVDVAGQVSKKIRDSGGGGVGRSYLRYSFRAMDGQTYSNKIAISDSEDDQYHEGDSIQLVYLANKPNISAMKTMVEQCREALEKKGK